MRVKFKTKKFHFAHKNWFQNKKILGYKLHVKTSVGSVKLGKALAILVFWYHLRYLVSLRYFLKIWYLKGILFAQKCLILPKSMKITIKFRLTKELCEILQLNFALKGQGSIKIE